MHYGYIRLSQNKKTPSVEEMMEKASDWTDVYMSRFAIQRGSDIKSVLYRMIISDHHL